MAELLKERLLFVGGKLAVYGVDLTPGRWWHILRPGSFNVPQVGDQGIAIGRSHCGRLVATNGYAQDHVPGTEELCPACRGQL